MYEVKTNAYYASEIAEFLGTKHFGENCVVYDPRSVDGARDHSMLFVDNEYCRDFDYSRIKHFADILIITNEDISKKTPHSFIVTKNPRLDYVKCLTHFFLKIPKAELHPSALIHPDAKLGKGVSVGPGVFIGPEVTIGDGTIIGANTVIDGRVAIGRRCVIKPNATIGSEGFSFVFDKDRLEHFPQIGGIVIGDEVWIGSNSTVERAALDDTVIEDGVKVDDLVQIGHNTRIGRQSQITAGAVICGRAVIGASCWIAPNACIERAVKVGANSLVGMGAVVRKDVEPGSVVAGVPARFLRKNT